MQCVFLIHGIVGFETFQMNEVIHGGSFLPVMPVGQQNQKEIRSGLFDDEAADGL